MAQSLSAKKRIRQNAKCRMANRSLKSEIRTLTKKLKAHVESKEGDAAQRLLRALVSRLDKAAKGNVYHPNNAARQKSTASRLVNTVSG